MRPGPADEAGCAQDSASGWRQRRVRPEISAVERAGLAGLNEGQSIEFEEISNRGKASAEISRSQAEDRPFSLG
jgi:CspA family cold shock protein